MKPTHDTFCPLPWISLEASPIGTVRPCCLADVELLNVNDERIRVTEVPLADIQNNPQLITMREQFLKGDKPKECRRCWAVEKSGGTSKRMHTLDRLEDILADETEWTTEAKELKFLDLKLGNICNLACRICGSWSSSTYAGEELKELPYEARNFSFAKVMVKEGAWPRDKNSNFWNELDFHADEIRYLEFTGGEPFMIKEHFEFLQKLVDRNLAKNIEIHYNTNGTIYPDQYVDLWNNFKLVEIAISIDDIGERFEYQRHGAKWNAVQENLYRFIKLHDDYNKIQLQICTTVNIFNVYYLEEVAQWLADYKDRFDFIYWNMLHDAPVHCITSLPQHAKEVISTRLEEADVIPEFKKEFENIIKFMKGNSSVPLHEVRQNIATLDNRKHEDLKQVQPELYELIYEETR